MYDDAIEKTQNKNTAKMWTAQAKTSHPYEIQ